MGLDKRSPVHESVHFPDTWSLGSSISFSLPLWFIVMQFFCSPALLDWSGYHSACSTSDPSVFMNPSWGTERRSSVMTCDTFSMLSAHNETFAAYPGSFDSNPKRCKFMVVMIADTNGFYHLIFILECHQFTACAVTVFLKSTNGSGSSPPRYHHIQQMSLWSTQSWWSGCIPSQYEKEDMGHRWKKDCPKGCWWLHNLQEGKGKEMSTRYEWLAAWTNRTCRTIDLFGPYQVRDDVKKRVKLKVRGVVF